MDTNKLNFDWKIKGKQKVKLKTESVCVVGGVIPSQERPWCNHRLHSFEY